MFNYEPYFKRLLAFWICESGFLLKLGRALLWIIYRGQVKYKFFPFSNRLFIKGFETIARKGRFKKWKNRYVLHKCDSFSSFSGLCQKYSWSSFLLWTWRPQLLGFSYGKLHHKKVFFVEFWNFEIFSINNFQMNLSHNFYLKLRFRETTL